MWNKRIICFAACILILAFLAGCTLNILYAIPLLTPGSDDAGELAIAIQPNGLKHLLWEQPYPTEPSLSSMIYRRLWYGSPMLTVYYPTWNTVYNLKWPDIAVTSDGTAYPVWAILESSDVGLICFDIIPPTGEHTPPTLCDNLTTGKIIRKGALLRGSSPGVR